MLKLLQNHQRCKHRCLQQRFSLLFCNYLPGWTFKLLFARKLSWSWRSVTSLEAFIYSTLFLNLFQSPWIIHIWWEKFWHQLRPQNSHLQASKMVCTHCLALPIHRVMSTGTQCRPHMEDSEWLLLHIMHIFHQKPSSLSQAAHAHQSPGLQSSRLLVALRQVSFLEADGTVSKFPASTRRHCVKHCFMLFQVAIIHL